LGLDEYGGGGGWYFVSLDGDGHLIVLSTSIGELVVLNFHEAVSNNCAVELYGFEYDVQNASLHYKS
jgi:hypothetical protein